VTAHGPITANGAQGGERRGDPEETFDPLLRNVANWDESGPPQSATKSKADEQPSFLDPSKSVLLRIAESG
jgi:hypothetical protein